MRTPVARKARGEVEHGAEKNWNDGSNPTTAASPLLGDDRRFPGGELADAAVPGVDDHDAFDDMEPGLVGRRRALENRAAHADGGRSRVDPVGALVGMPGGEAEDALVTSMSRLACGVPTARPDEMRQPDRRARPYRQIRAVG